MSKELVSVCLPVYNGERTIKETLDSIIEQTYDNIEIIVVDNCSTDNTVEIVKSIQCDKIRLYCNDANLGMAGNWNKCLEYVKGKYIQFVCADDLLLPESVEKKVKMIRKDSNISMVFSASQIINDNNQMVMERHQYHKSCIVDGTKLAKKSYYSKNLYGEPSNVLFRADLIEIVGKFALNTCYTTDWDMWLRLSCQGKVGYVDQVLMKYRISISNETSKINYTKFFEDDKVMMRNIDGYNCMKLSVLDKMIHHIVYNLRVYARTIYMKINCK